MSTQTEQGLKKKKKRQINDVSELDQRVQELADELDDEEEHIGYILKLRIKEMAYHLENKYTLLNRPDKIIDICSEISNLSQFTNKENIRILVARYLDSKYKHKHTRESYQNVTEVTNQAEEIKSHDKHIIDKLNELVKTDPYDSGVKGNQKATELAAKFIKSRQDWSEDTGRPLDLPPRIKDKKEEDDKDKISQEIPQLT
jgi:hypothetical protein